MSIDNLFIYRLERDYKGTDCTLGKLRFNDKSVEILELPWKNNKPNVSCIPADKYIVEKTYSPHFTKILWLVKGVPNRSGIRIHIANFISELLGCLAPGLSRYDINNDGIIDVINSTKALKLMNEELPDKFIIDIVWIDK